MAQKFESASQKVTPRDAQKGGQGALSKEHPDIALEQDETHAEDDVDLQTTRPTRGLSADQIALLCGVEEWDLDKLTQDKRRDLDRLLSNGYIERTEASLGPHLKLTKKGTDFLSERGVGPNEA